MIHSDINDMLKTFDYLIDQLQDAAADNSIISMVEDAKDLLLEEISENSCNE